MSRSLGEKIEGNQEGGVCITHLVSERVGWAWWLLAVHPTLRSRGRKMLSSSVSLAYISQ